MWLHVLLVAHTAGGRHYGADLTWIPARCQEGTSSTRQAHPVDLPDCWHDTARREHCFLAFFRFNFVQSCLSCLYFFPCMPSCFLQGRSHDTAAEVSESDTGSDMSDVDSDDVPCLMCFVHVPCVFRQAFVGRCVLFKFCLCVCRQVFLVYAWGLEESVPASASVHLDQFSAFGVEPPGHTRPSSSNCSLCLRLFQ